MDRYKIRYSSMTASYDLGFEYAENKEQAERQARARANAFSNSEKPLIHATKE